MGRLILAFKAFFLILFKAGFADAVRRITAGETKPAAPSRPEPVRPAEQPKPRPSRSDALNLLAALQREGRFVDFIKESLDGYGDAQIGAAARDVHRDCAAVVERMFALRPLTDQSEGSSLEVADGFDAARYRLTGNVSGKPPLRGTVRHHGWQATRCELPEWLGSADAQRVVAPIELEVG